MIAKASASFIRISPRKVRYVIDHIRNKTVVQAQAILAGTAMRATGIVQKLLTQALDAAKRNSQMDAHQLKISKILADGGPSMKRFRAASMGRASSIKKRTSHVQLELDAIEQKSEKIGRQPKSVKTADTKSIRQDSAGTTQAKTTKQHQSKKAVGTK